MKIYLNAENNCCDVIKDNDGMFTQSISSWKNITFNFKKHTVGYQHKVQGVLREA